MYQSFAGAAQALADHAHALARWDHARTVHPVDSREYRSARACAHVAGLIVDSYLRDAGAPRTRRVPSPRPARSV